MKNDTSKILKRALFTFIILHTVINSSAQQTNLDSLFSVWQDESQTDSTRLKAIHDITWDGYLFSQPDSAFYFAQLQYDFAKRKGLKKRMAGALNIQGISFHLRGNYPKALNYYQRSLNIHEEIRNIEGIAHAAQNMGHCCLEQGNYTQALIYYQKSLKIKEEIGNKIGIAQTLNSIGNIKGTLGDISQALEYFQRSLQIQEEIGDEKGIAVSLNNIGIYYAEQDNYTQALTYYKKSLRMQKEIGDKIGIANAIHNIGSINLSQGDNFQALNHFQESLKIREEIGNKIGIVFSLHAIGSTYFKQGKNKLAIDYCQKGLILSTEIGAEARQKDACQCLYEAYKSLGKTSKALAFFEQMIVLKDSIYNKENTREQTRLEMQYKFDKKVAIAQAEQLKKDALVSEELKREKLRRNGFMGGFAVVLVFAGIFFSQRNKVKAGKKKSDELLLNILPAEIAEELKEKGSAQARNFDLSTILFTDFKGFTQQSEKMSPSELVSELNHCFKAFDGIIEKHSIEKIKTIGDSYMAAGGLPVPTKDSVKNTVLAALEIQAFVIQRKTENDANNKPAFQMRVGINTGPVVAGIVGVKKFQYDIWGDTVNTASRMESNGEVGKINISKTTYELLKDDADFSFESRGKINAKGKGEIEMWFVYLAQNR